MIFLFSSRGFAPAALVVAFASSQKSGFGLISKPQVFGSVALNVVAIGIPDIKM